MTDPYETWVVREKQFNRDMRRATYACVAFVVIVGSVLVREVLKDIAADRACEAKGGTAVAVARGLTHEVRCVKFVEVK
jgi:hypothetical protein